MQYRTAGDGRVREEHAAMHGITLPADDPFWDKYYPPNGWRCRCTAVEVNKGKYPVSDSEEAKRIGDKATTKLDRFGNNKAGIFRFNPGKEGKVFPPKHPYLPKGCEGCTRGMGNLSYNPNSEKCQACLSIGKTAQAEEQKATIEQHRQQFEKLKSDSNYKDVVFDEKTGGLKATHKDHSLSKVGGVYERHVQNAGYKNGHSVILEAEKGNVYKLRYTEGKWDGLEFEVAGRETATVNNVLKGLKHCAGKRETQIALLDYPNGGFDEQILLHAIARYKGLEKLKDGQFIPFKQIICVQNEEIVYQTTL